jgi:hypothetical protein
MKLPPDKSREVVRRVVRLGLTLFLALFAISDFGCAAFNVSLSAARERLQSHPNPARDYGGIALTPASISPAVWERKFMLLDSRPAGLWLHGSRKTGVKSAACC